MRSACSVNVPNGPKNPTLAGASVVTGGTGARPSGQAIGAARRRPVRFGRRPDSRPRRLAAWVAVDEPALRALLDDLAAGRIDADDVVRRLRRLPFADVGDALVDHHRSLRQGMPEAVYGPGKTPEQCVRIVGELLAPRHGRRCC